MTGTWVGPGSAAPNTGKTSRRESIKTRTFPARQLYFCHPFIFCDLDLVIYVRAPNLLERKCDCLGFLPAGNRTLLSPAFLVLLQLYLRGSISLGGLGFRV